MYLILYYIAITTFIGALDAQEDITSTSAAPIQGIVTQKTAQQYVWNQEEERIASQAVIGNNNQINESKTLSSGKGYSQPTNYTINTLRLPPPPPPLLPTPPTFSPTPLPSPSFLSHPERIYTRSASNRIIRRIPTTPLPIPYFDSSSPTNISAQLGTHAFLPCTIRNINNNSISWIRSRDSHILTVSRYTFIADERFQAWHEEETETWTLQIKYVQERDAGRYECQLSTEPKMSHFVQFNVVTPLVHIPGGPDIYVKSGSTVTLKCIISGALILPEYIFWYQGSERVVAEEGSGGRDVYVEKISEDTTIGTLIITTAYPKDQGSYTCVPASLPTAAVTLHVLNAGEHPAAMYHGGGSSKSSLSPLHLLICLTAGGLVTGIRSPASPSYLPAVLSIIYVISLLMR